MKPKPTIKIESGIPIQPRYRWKEILNKMKPGQSIMVESHNQRQAVMRAARDNEVSVTARKVNGKGIRIWRKP